MPPKPTTSQSCNTHSCNFTVNFPTNTGWGATVQTTFYIPSKPSSVIIQGTCDDIATFWLNGVVVYQRLTCNCSDRSCYCEDDCAIGFNFQAAHASIAGTNSAQFQCNDICGGQSGGTASISVNS